MAERTQGASPRLTARLAGVFYLVTLLTGIFAQFFVSGKLVVFGDAAATATNILAHKSFYQSGFLAYLVEMACFVAFTALLYELLKPVSRSMSLLAAFLSLVGCAIKTFSRVLFLAPLFILGGAHYWSVFNREQLQVLSLLFLEVNNQGAGISLAFFGFYAVVTGCLIFKSTFLPRILGVLSVLQGLCWLTFLSPTLYRLLFPYLAALALLGIVALILWLLTFGVNEERWREQARVTAASLLT